MKKKVNQVSIAAIDGDGKSVFQILFCKFKMKKFNLKNYLFLKKEGKNFLKFVELDVFEK